MKRIFALILALLTLCAAASAEGSRLGYRFADAEEAAALIASNDEYYDPFNQNDIDFRLQQKGGTIEDLKAFAVTQTLDFTPEETAAIDESMAAIEQVCANGAMSCRRWTTSSLSRRRCTRSATPAPTPTARGSSWANCF